MLEQNNVWQQAVQKICSIDLKKEEPGLLLFCAEHGILLETYDAETLRNLDGEFTASAFVSQVTGVDNVCERSAMAGSQEWENSDFQNGEKRRDGSLCTG